MVPGGGFNISPLKPQNGRPRTQVQHLMQIDLKGWGVFYISSFQQHCLLQMLNNVADERSAHPRIPVVVNMASTPMSSKKSQKLHNCSGGFNISPLKPQNGRPRTQVQHLMQIDLKGWGVGYISSFQQHCLLQMLNNVAGLREYFSQTDERSAHPRIPVMVNMASTPMSSKKSQKLHNRSTSLEQINAANKNGMTMDEYTDEDDEFQIPDPEACSMCLESDVKKTEEECTNQIDLSCFSGNLQRDDRDNGRDCWRISDGNNFRVRGNNFYHDKSKANTRNELPERLIGAVRVSHIELSSAIVPNLDQDPLD
ncbi:hypothetical protein TEA_026769 [Camellia sinensis var. sinensis]|uniref:START domain-containing protein n=1 Tax=Camellia sinensis var. sinensis TaxID=542762 RepID=A0A4S4D8A7_CAMSN|nr:hypothetical protein TEA_026769 [Camellia sinensis var. sinensis]